MVRLVLIAALAGCYAPDVADCVDRCDSSNLCPDGLTCQAGFCRADGASGTCSTAQDMPDAATAMCPPIPMMQGCTLAGAQPVTPYCYVLCAAATGTSANAFTAGGSWHAAVLDSPGKLAAAVTAAGASPAWIGLEQGSGAAAPDASWSWHGGTAATQLPWNAGQPDDGDHTENGAEQCATLAGSGFSDEACTASHVFLIQP